MTRINVVSVETLHNKHLAGEYKEITRVYALSRKAQYELLQGKRNLPQVYILGGGHVLFFYDKLGYITKRYQELTAEMLRRGYKPNPIPVEELLKGIDSRLCKDYNPTTEAIEINMKRIAERMPK